MKYAYSQNERVEATPKAQGICICCGSEMIAKCGNQKIWHWAHKNRRQCDTWWENETQWHRDWKNCFPEEWQEVVHFADDGEKHIADVKTPSGLVIEFQHSAIKPDEQLSRERFYKKMVWIVNGTRLKTDSEKFASFAWSDPNYYQRLEIDWWDDLFPRKWRNRSVTVYFDTGDPEYLICLPKQGYAPNYYYVPRTLFKSEFSDVLRKFGDGFFVDRPGEYFINLMEEKLQDALLEAKNDGVNYRTVAYKVRRSHHYALEKMGLGKNEISAFKKISSIQHVLQQAKKLK
jgi:competence protein CoiA